LSETIRTHVLCDILCISTNLIWVGQASLQWEVLPMKFSITEVIMLGMLFLALLTYLKRK